MRFLESAPRFLFFTGKGGVGKTSIACATAIQLAEAGRRVLLVSTDPASNVGQVFGVSIGNKITPISDVPRLFALEIDPEMAAQAYRDRIVGPVRGKLPDPVVKGIEEQLSGACTTEIAAFDEFTALLTDTEITSAYDHIVFDTAPTGHTIRLLQLPVAWSGFLEAGKGDPSCLGPLAGLGKQRAQYNAAVQALADGQRTRLVLVARAQNSALREAARTHGELAAIGLSQQFLIVNGLLPKDEAALDPLAKAIYGREQAALAAMPDELRALPRDDVPLKPFNLVGLNALRQLLVEATPQPEATGEPVALHASSLSDLVDDIAAEGHGLVMLMGKGGVGKTTLAAAVAVHLARRGLPVHLTTSDPAAHLTETLHGSMAHLTVSLSIRTPRPNATGRKCCERKARSSMPKGALCSKRICVRHAPRKSPSFRPSHASSARRAKNSWSWTPRQPVIPCCIWTRQAPTTARSRACSMPKARITRPR
jgi:arsenite-transporting ATPase